VPDGRLTFQKAQTRCSRSGNATRDTIPSHLLVGAEVSPEVARFTPTCVRRRLRANAQGLRVNPANCVDCKATDVLGPRWLPREVAAVRATADVMRVFFEDLRRGLREFWAPPKPREHVGASAER